jgi:hypothetical protein
MADYPFAHADAPAEFSAVFPVRNMSGETLALLTGMHPAHFDVEGIALVEGIIERKEAKG